jgi:hypothetical protein
MKTDTMVFEMYPYNRVTNTMTIPIRLSRFDDLYNPIDPSPAPTRDLSKELVDYLDQCSNEIDSEFKIDLTIEIINEPVNLGREKECLGSINNFYKHEIFVTEKRIKTTRKSAFKHLLISLACLSTYVISMQFEMAGLITDILKEAILIGGWVFMWESVTHNFIQIEPFYDEIKKFERIISAPIRFVYSVEE